MSVLIFDIPDKVTTVIMVAIDKEHNGQELVFHNHLGLFSLCCSGQIRISCDASKDFLDSLRMHSNATAQSVGIHNQVLKLFIVFVIWECLLLEAIHLRFSIKQAVNGFLVSLMLNHAVLN